MQHSSEMELLKSFLNSRRAEIVDEKILNFESNNLQPKIVFFARTWFSGDPDFEYLAVICYPTTEWMKVQTPRDKLCTTLHSSQQPKFRVDEIYKFCDLLWRGDIVAVESLYLDDTHVIHASEEWKQLVTQRKCLANTRLLLSHYAGQPRSQLLHRTRTVEWYNLWKLIFEAERLLKVFI